MNYDARVSIRHCEENTTEIPSVSHNPAQVSLAASLEPVPNPFPPPSTNQVSDLGASREYPGKEYHFEGMHAKKGIDKPRNTFIEL